MLPLICTVPPSAESTTAPPLPTPPFLSPETSKAAAAPPPPELKIVPATEEMLMLPPLAPQALTGNDRLTLSRADIRTAPPQSVFPEPVALMDEKMLMLPPGAETTILPPLAWLEPLALSWAPLPPNDTSPPAVTIVMLPAVRLAPEVAVLAE